MVHLLIGNLEHTLLLHCRADVPQSFKQRNTVMRFNIVQLFIRNQLIYRFFVRVRHAALHQLFKQPVHVLLRQTAALQQNFTHRKDLTIGQLADLCIQPVAAKPLVINDRLIVVLFLKEVAQ